jgi:uncharacterized protein DUF4112
VSEQTALSRDLQRVRRLARLLDTAVRIPIIGVRFGLDAVLGLVPGAGDAVSAVLSGYPMLIAARHRLPATVVVRMLGNIAFDAIAGSLPVLGDIFDVGFKANIRNQRLIERYAERPERTARVSGALIWLAVGGVMLIAVALIALALWIVSTGLARITG